MRLWTAPFVALLAWLAGPAAAADRSGACAPATAGRAAIAEVQADFERWRGRCVRLAGILAERRLHSDRAALAEPSSGAVARHSIVVYPEGPGRKRRPPRMAEIVGTIGSCELHHAAAAAAQAQDPESIVWASGYCHTSMETYIRPASIRVVSGRPVTRLTEAELPPEARPLVDAPAGAPGHGAHVGAARAMAAAIARRDKAAFLSLADPETAIDLAELGGKRPPGWLRRNRREALRKFEAQSVDGNVFAGLHPVEARQERVLADRRDLAGTAPGGPLARAATCWCREPDCAGRWPVLEADADNDPARPYACVRTSHFLVYKKGTYIQADASPRPRPFAEPGPR